VIVVYDVSALENSCVTLSTVGPVETPWRRLAVMSEVGHIVTIIRTVST
jgi:hypothetical protein